MQVSAIKIYFMGQRQVAELVFLLQANERWGGVGFGPARPGQAQCVSPLEKRQEEEMRKGEKAYKERLPASFSFFSFSCLYSPLLGLCFSCLLFSCHFQR